MGFWTVRACRCGGQSALGALAILILASPAVAQSVSVSLPSAAQIAGVGLTTPIDVSVGSVTDLEAGAISFTYDDTIVMPTTVALGALLATPSGNCTDTPNLGTSGRVTITFACQNAVNGSGVLFEITFQGVASGVSALTFSATGEIPDGCSLNEGTPACDPLQNGQVTVAGPAGTATATATGTPTGTATATATVTATPTDTAAPVNTATASASATRTNTNTPGPSPTSSQTGTATFTATVTATPQNTATATQTRTITPTPTVTLTRTVTPTRPGAIPAVPSPLSPAGLIMISGLGVGLLWALRRLAKIN